jgi:excalibur calcium-binding domain-containing protein
LLVKRTAAVAVAAALILAAPVAAGAKGGMVVDARPLWSKNCTALNKKYPHGVGRAKARDKTSDAPVTNFKRSTRLYNLAMSYNKGLDRDKDGIACEND